MADANVPQEHVKAIFKQLLDVHKHEIRLIVLEELISECYGPQALLNGRKITDVISFKEWLEAKLQQAKEQQAEEVTPKTTSPTLTKEELKKQWEAKRKAAE
jgi:hypothetical protein